MIRTSAPGKVVLLGEHAVLEHGRAIVAAIDKRIEVELFPATQRQHDDNPILQEIIRFFDPPSGFGLRVRSDLQKGLGSSSAFTVAVMAAFHLWLKPVPKKELFKNCLRIVHKTQNNIGSGIDLMAAIYGGVLYCDNGDVMSLDFPATLSLVDTGLQAKTTEVVQHLRDTQNPQDLRQALKAIDDGVGYGLQAIQTQNWTALGETFNQQQRIMKALGLSTPSIDRQIEALWHQEDVLGAKLSGAGKGDFIVVLEAGDYVPQTKRNNRISAPQSGLTK